MRSIAAKVYERRAARLFTPEGRVAAEAEIIARAEEWPIVPGTGGARKARIALPGRGKRGGARVIYFFSKSDELIAFFALREEREGEPE
jgi:hypothetical protein